MTKPRVRPALIAASLALFAPAACAPSGQYMGIDISAPHVTAPLSAEARAAMQMRDILMLITISEGCYERVPGGFRAVPAEQASSFECAEKLAAIENLDARLGAAGKANGLTSMDLAALARRANAGDKRAQLDLGVRFEEGIGMERDPAKARKLYAQAATTSGGTIWVYSPPVGNGTSGRVIPVDRGPRQPGLAEAKQRLVTLERRQTVVE